MFDVQGAPEHNRTAMEIHQATSNPKEESMTRTTILCYLGQDCCSNNPQYVAGTNETFRMSN